MYNKYLIIVFHQKAPKNLYRKKSYFFNHFQNGCQKMQIYYKQFGMARVGVLNSLNLHTIARNSVPTNKYVTKIEDFNIIIEIQDVRQDHQRI